MKKWVIAALFAVSVIAIGIYIGTNGNRKKNEAPVKPAPPAMLIYADPVEALVSAAVGSEGSLDAKVTNEILKPFEKTVEDISEITGGMITMGDIEAGRITAERLKQLGDTYKVAKDTYAIQLEIYELELSQTKE